MKQQTRSASAVGHERRTIYLPPQRPGFAAWTAAFDYGDGRLGLSFKETVREKNTGFRPPKLELGEAIGAPVSYCSVECGGSEERSYRVYLLSEDGGRSYRESGRCPLEEGPFCCTGFPDGRIVGLTCPDRNAGGTGGGDGILVRESRDGVVRDFVAVGDVDIRVIGADAPILDSEIPVRQLLEQIVAKTGIPPFMLGLNWNSTERMSAQQADMLTTEITAIRRTLTPALERICGLWLRMHGYTCGFSVVWEDINLQDQVEEAKAAWYRQQARQIAQSGERAERGEG